MSRTITRILIAIALLFGVVTSGAYDGAITAQDRAAAVVERAPSDPDGQMTNI